MAYGNNQDGTASEKEGEGELWAERFCLLACFINPQKG